MSSTIDEANFSALVIENLNKYLSVEDRPYQDIEELFMQIRE